MRFKLNPQLPASPSSTSTVGKISYPGYQEILDFLAAGGESSTSVTVDGDVDQAYKIYVRTTDSAQSLGLVLNGDSSNIYGVQYLQNDAGTITAARATFTKFYCGNIKGTGEYALLTPANLPKQFFGQSMYWTSGSAVDRGLVEAKVYNSTSNITSLTFAMDTGTFDAGVRITVYARRAQ